MFTNSPPGDGDGSGSYSNPSSSSNINDSLNNGVVTPSVTESLLQLHNRPICQSPGPELPPQQQQNWNIFSPSIQKSLAFSGGSGAASASRPRHHHSLSAGGPIRSSGVSSISMSSSPSHHNYSQQNYRNQSWRHSVSLPVSAGGQQYQYDSLQQSLAMNWPGSFSAISNGSSRSAPPTMNRNLSAPSCSSASSSSSSSNLASPVLPSSATSNSFSSSCIPSPLQQEIQLEAITAGANLNNNILISESETSSQSPQSLLSSPNIPYDQFLNDNSNSSTTPPLSFAHLEQIQHIQQQQQLHRCKFCNKDFFEAQHLLEHTKLHMNESTRHLCTYCGVTFGRKHDLLRHGKSHDKSKLEYCSHCNKGKI